MPKSSKKKKDKVADFSKAKLKLGKGKKLPTNVVDTSFKARSIALPTQSITVEKDHTVPTTRRRQTFNDILSLLKHYSAGTRKDAIFSARELFENHPELLESSITPLVGACVRLIADEDPSVRKALLSFFWWLLPRVRRDAIVPHIPLLLLFTTSAQTHIFPEIRIDAVRFLDIFLGIVPETVVDGWDESHPGHGKRALEGYLGILNAGTKMGGAEGTAQATSTASVVLSPQSKLVVLRSLSSFLGLAVDPQSLTSGLSGPDVCLPAISLPTWFLRPSFTCRRLYEENVTVFQVPQDVNSGKQVVWNVQPELESFDEDFVYDSKTMSGPPDAAWTLNDLSKNFFEQDDSSRALGDIPFVMRLTRTLYATLTATSLDCAPIVFSLSTNPPETDLQMLTAALQITRTLYSAILQNTKHGDIRQSCEELKTLLGYLTGYFPFKPAHGEVKMEQAFQDLNVIYCELTSLLVLVSSRSDTGYVQCGNSRLRPPRSKAASLRGDAKLDVQAKLVSSYVIRLLRGEGESGSQLPRPVSPTVYTALLPTIWALLNQVTGLGGQLGNESSLVLSATLDHALRTTANSGVKRLTIEFVARLLLLEKERGYTGHFNPRHAGEDRKFREWVLHLPQALWELGTGNFATSQIIICVLLRLLHRGSCVIQCEQISSLSSRLVPFFLITHPIRGQVLGKIRGGG
ncbi:hypothetical protein PAXRUDRAFT_828751 [Paxillus rubicundulus Ve08.2h10]|uniref:Pre-rRNA-processing protein n=1 Tax=Paxillus rubicundulus Ve08.2h10 TaxID=930991 RepID=A0A0D0DVP6_9AGAM|nr:hypothetical protein PAXRUDRAFT_828751 [Paxillus rubicundulus Ve08.2h10]